jgi:hypothetical protein
MTRARMRATEREPMRRMPWGPVLCVLILGAALASCDGPSRGSNTLPSAASGLELVVTASPNVVRGATAGSGLDTGGCSQIQVVVSKAGELVDGAEVTGSATLGVFRVGTEDFLNFFGITTNGTLTRTWCSKSERGTAIVTVNVEDATATVLITIF